MTKEEAKSLYCKGEKVYQFINGEGYQKYAPSYYYTSHEPSEQLFERQFNSNQITHGKNAHDDFVGEEGYTEWLALCHAEHYGIYAYEVDTKKRLMKWVSYFGSEGFYSVVYNLDTHEEVRKHQKSTKKEYNYYCG